MAADSAMNPSSPPMPPPPQLKTLTDAQRVAFDELKQLCEEHNNLWPPSEAASARGIGHNHDVTLLRYLRARSYDAPAAFQQYSATAAWRASNGVDAVFENASVSLFEHTRRLFPHWTGRRDKQGLPVFVYVVADVQTADLVELGKRDPELTSIVLPAEAATAFDMPLCAALHPDGVVDRGVNIIDLSGVSLRQFWGLRNHLQRASRMATSHYPETVDRMFIIGAPSYFPTVWGFITRWFDPSTTNKINVVPKADVLRTLEQYIDKEDIPVRFGGDLQWSFGKPPCLDEDFRPLLGELMDNWTPGPLRFFSGVDGVDVLAVGTTDDGQKRCEVLGKDTPSIDGVMIVSEKSPELMDLAAVVSAETA